MKIALIELGLIAACMLLAYIGLRKLLRKTPPDDRLPMEEAGVTAGTPPKPGPKRDSIKLDLPEDDN